MRKALDEATMDARLRERWFEALTQTARHLVNRPA
jgi:truncated hemoglobin YjbI